MKVTSSGASDTSGLRVPVDQGPDQLRFLTCGSVDDGKSTLIGRLLYDAAMLFDDQREALERDSSLFGTTGEDADVALLLDGLEAEREQGITIDVAYRYFSTARRRFIVADTPGHQQYTRNMVTGASTCEFAILLVDASKGLLDQTRRHAYIVSLLGIRDVVLAVNKVDLIDYDHRTFAQIRDAFSDLAAPLDFQSLLAIPTSARFGDNVVKASSRMPWYEGPTLLEYLETVRISSPDAAPFRMPVQWVNRPDASFRGFSGTLAGGELRPGDEIVVMQSGQRSRVERIATFDGDLPRARTGDAVTLTLADEIDVSRGNVLANPQDRAVVADAFAAHLVWLSDAPLLPGRSYLLKSGAQTIGATVTEIKHRVDINDFSRRIAKELQLNDIALVNVTTTEPIAIDPYHQNRTTGSFILIDRISNATAGAGMIDFALRRGTNLGWQSFDITKERRAAMKGQKPAILWFTGLSGAGKSTIANLLEKKLAARGKHTILLDGDNIRHGLNKDLGFTEADRVENIRRAAEVAKLFVDAGLIVLVSFISPFRAERRMARALVGDGEFVEIHVDAPLSVCEQRDPKGLYRKARAGLLPNFTAVDSPYEPPETPELRLDSAREDPDTLADRILAYMDRNGFLGLS